MTEEKMSADTKEVTGDSAGILVGNHFATKPDGSLIDPVSSEGDCLVGELAMPDGTSPQDPQDSLPQPEETQDSGSNTAAIGEDTAVPMFELGGEGTELEGEVIEEQVIEPRAEEQLTPVKDQFDVPKSLPGSGVVTPASSHSDQSLTFSSSEKGTPNTRLKSGDVRQLDYDSMSSSSGSVKNLQLPQRAGISWRKGERLEAMDYLNSWFPAKIRSINEEDMQVLIHFDGWNQRYDEWIDMSSDRIRPLVRHSERKEKSKRAKSSGFGRSSVKSTGKKPLKEHNIGDAVYAKWTDCKMYPAKITNILPNGTYEVIFYDGFKKLVQPINIRSMPKEYRQKSFEVNPVPDVVSKKARMKVDNTDHSLSQQEIQDDTTSEKIKEETVVGRESSIEKEKKQSRTKKRRMIVPGLISDAATTGVRKPATSEVQVKSEPVSTQTDYAESSKMDSSDIKVEQGTSGGQIITQPQVQTQVAPVGILPPKAFVVESDHNQYKCQFEGCNKSFRKEHLLDYHIKYYHINGGAPQPPPAKRRRKTTSTCSTESESVASGKKMGSKKNRNFSTEGAVCPQDLKQDFAEVQNVEETGEISTQTTHRQHTESYSNDDFIYGIKHDSMEESSVTDAEEFLKPDELVNCICDFQEENGLMIQCEVCMCWQHAACFGITERTLPKTYICFVCENPPGVRESSRYIHEQDWFKTGEIASFSFLPLPPMSEERCSTVKSTHTLVVEIQQLNAVLHSLKLQLKILRTKDESKLKMWRVDWDTVETETIESFAFPKDEKNAYSLENMKPGETTVPQNGSSKAGMKVGKTTWSQNGSKEGVIKAEETPLPQSSSSTDAEKTGEATVPVLKSEIKEEVEVKTEIKADTSNDSEQVVEPVKSERTVYDVKVEDKEEESQSSTTTGEVLTNSAGAGKEVNESVATDVELKEIKTESEPMIIDNNTDMKQVVTKKIEETEEGNHSDSTESVVEDPIEVCEKNLLSHILRVQAEISDRFDKIQEQIEMLEAMEAMQSRRELPTSQNVLNDMPHLKRSLRTMENDLFKVKKMSVFH